MEAGMRGRTEFAVILLALSICCEPTASSFAQGLGDVVSPRGQLPLREAPPDAFTGVKGDSIGTVEPNKGYRIIDQKNISTIFGGERWLRLEDITSAQKGWIYSGPSNSKEQNVISCVTSKC